MWTEHEARAATGGSDGTASMVRVTRPLKRVVESVRRLLPRRMPPLVARY
jgi:hypothetical protein